MRLTEDQERAAEFISNAYGIRPSVSDALVTYNTVRSNVDGFVWHVSILVDAARNAVRDDINDEIRKYYCQLADSSIAKLQRFYGERLDNIPRNFTSHA